MSDIDREDIYQLIAHLEGITYDLKKVPLSGGKCLIDKDEFLGIIDSIRRSLPIEITHAQKVLASREEIVSAANREANEFIKRAKEKSAMLITQETIVKEANNAATELKRQAEAQARETIAKANAHATQLVADAEASVRALTADTTEKLKRLRNVTNEFIETSLNDVETSFTISLNEVKKAKQNYKAKISQMNVKG